MAESAVKLRQINLILHLTINRIILKLSKKQRSYL